MDQNVELNLDREFRKHLQILRPYLGRLIDQNEIDICNAWVKKLSDSKDDKVLRNKYVFALCYQLSKGILDEPFLKLPPTEDLLPLQDVNSSYSSFTEVECLVIDSENENTKVNCDKETLSQIFTDDSGINIDKNKDKCCADTNCDFLNMFGKGHLYETRGKMTPQSYKISYTHDDYSKCSECDENYQVRANNLIMKLREIKNQNILLRNELMILRQESNRDDDELIENGILKIDNTTSTHNCNQENNTALASLKLKLQELQSSRNNLIESVGILQDKIDYFNDIKKHEFEEMEAMHKLEIIKLRTLIREEVKNSYENKLNELKKQYETLTLEIQDRTKEEIEKNYKSQEQIIVEKDKLLQIKETEISTLKRQLEELKGHQFSVLNKFLDGSNENRNESAKTYELEKRLYKMEKMKNRCSKAYEAKVASLQREKHLAECSLQLQLVKQRAQVLNEVTEENQVELTSALDKLENKYKEIVANVQATAVQRRLQDQFALESLIQAVCTSVPKENPFENPTNVNANQFSGNIPKTHTKERQRSCDREFGTLCNNNKVDNVIIENTSFGGDSTGTGYCLDSEKLHQLFERVHIPQRDVGDVPK